jgi:hypothetical protein
LSIRWLLPGNFFIEKWRNLARIWSPRSVIRQWAWPAEPWRRRRPSAAASAAVVAVAACSGSGADLMKPFRTEFTEIKPDLVKFKFVIMIANGFT